MVRFYRPASHHTQRGKGFALAFSLHEQPKPTALAAYGERWAPYRTVASWYLWRTADRG